MFTGFRKMGENPKIDLIKPALLKIWWFVSGDRDKQELKEKMYSTLFLSTLCKGVILKSFDNFMQQPKFQDVGTIIDPLLMTLSCKKLSLLFNVPSTPN